MEVFLEMKIMKKKSFTYQLGEWKRTRYKKMWSTAGQQAHTYC
jgi:hypothetical protein